MIVLRILTCRFAFMYVFKFVLSYTIYQPQCFLPPIPPVTPKTSLHRSTCYQFPFISLQKREDLPGLSTKHNIRSDNATRHMPSYQSWTRQPNRRTPVPQTGTRVRANVYSQCEKSHSNTKLHNYNIYAQGLAEIHTGSVFSLPPL